MSYKRKQFKIPVDSTDIVFRTMSAQEADNVFAIIDTYGDNISYIESIFNNITDSKYNINELSAGAPLVVIYVSLKLSGYFKDTVDLPNIIESYREKITNNTFYTIYSTISQILPLYKLEELKELSTNELFELFAFAEKVASKQLFDTAKMKKSIDDANLPPSQVVKKGVAGITKDELEMLQYIISREEEQYQGMPH